MEVYADASVATCYPSPASQLQAGEGPSPAAEERSSAMDDATPTEQSALASSSAAGSVGYGRGAAKPRRAGESTAAGRWSGNLGACDAHCLATKVIIITRNKTSDSNAEASCRKVRHTSFFFMIHSPLN